MCNLGITRHIPGNINSISGCYDDTVWRRVVIVRGVITRSSVLVV